MMGRRCAVPWPVAWGVFGVQNAGEAGVQGEEAQGKRLAMLARESGVEHYLYTPVGSADKRTGVPHFDNKWRIEEAVRGLGFPSHVILRPVFFMENLVAPFSLQGSTLGLVDMERDPFGSLLVAL